MRKVLKGVHQDAQRAVRAMQVARGRGESQHAGRALGPDVDEQPADVEHARPVLTVAADPGVEQQHVEVEPMRFVKPVEFPGGFLRVAK